MKIITATPHQHDAPDLGIECVEADQQHGAGRDRRQPDEIVGDAQHDQRTMPITPAPSTHMKVSVIARRIE